MHLTAMTRIWAHALKVCSGMKFYFSQLMILALCSLASLTALGEEVSLLRTYSTMPLHSSMGKALEKPDCRIIFETNHFQDTATQDALTSAGEIDTLVINRSDPAENLMIQQLVVKVLKDWVDTRDYTPEQAYMLYLRDRKLDRRRTTYYHLRNSDHSAVIRVFDGSTHVLSMGEQWMNASVTDSTTPLEIGSPGYQLPERRIERMDPSRPAFLWELSLLNIDRHLQSGVESILSNVALKLDLQYNDKEMAFFNRTTLIEARGMMIYAQTRPNRVAILKKYGFHPVIAVDSAGVAREFEVSKNSVLMQMSAADFLRKHTSPVRHASSRQFDLRGREPTEGSIQGWQENLQHWDMARVLIYDYSSAMSEFEKVFVHYKGARKGRGLSEERFSHIIDFFKTYLAFLNSVPESMRDSDWTSHRITARAALINPEIHTAFYRFADSLERFGEAASIQTPQDEYDFYHSEPPRGFTLSVPVVVDYPMGVR